LLRKILVLDRFAAIVLLVFCLPATAAETARLRYHDLTSRMDSFESLPAEARDRVRLTVRVVAEKAAQPVQMWMSVNGQRYDLPIDDFGFIDVPRTPDVLSADPLIETNQPKGSIETKLAMILLLPDPQRFPYNAIRTAARQTDALIDKAAGLASFLVPSVKGVQFRCPKGDPSCVVVVHRRSGDETLRPDPEGRIRLDLTPTLDSEDPMIEASIPLRVVEPLLN
jgi:hypothetical protein